MRRHLFRPVLLLRSLPVVLLLCLASRSRIEAQVGQGTIEGVVVRAADETPLPFAIVRLLRVEPSGVAMGVLTDSVGRFQFTQVPAGEYRLQLDLIGYQRTLTPPMHVRPAETLFQQIRSTLQPFELPGLVVRPEGSCVGADQLREDPGLAALWSEAGKGVEMRRSFERQYSFTRRLRQEIKLTGRLRPDEKMVRDDTVFNTPDSVRVWEARRRAAHREGEYVSRGRGRSFVLTEMDEKELLDEEFLRENCLVTPVEESDGVLALRFRTARPRRKGTSVHGTIRLDAETYLTRQLEYEYREGKRVLGRVTIDYADVPIAGSLLRMASTGKVTSFPGFGGISSVDGTLSFSYWGARRVGSD